MKIQKSLAVIFVYSILTGMLIFNTDYASASTKVGSSAAQFLKIGVGARAAAMSGSFVAIADDPSALYWNPGGAGWLHDKQLMVSRTESFAEINHEYAAALLPLSGSTTLGLSLTTLYTPEMEQTTIQEPDGTGVYFDTRDVAIGLTFARQMTDRFAFGLTGKYIQQNLFNESAKTVAFDVGGVLETGFRGMRIGVSMNNFGGKMRLDGRDLIVSHDDRPEVGNPLASAKLETQGWSLPIIFRLGLAMDAVGGRSGLLINEKQRLTLSMDGYHVNDAQETMSLGLEYGWNEILFFRGGYRLNHDSEKFSLGFGTRVNLRRWEIQVNYSFSDMSDLGDVQRFGAGVTF